MVEGSREQLFLCRVVLRPCGHPDHLHGAAQHPLQSVGKVKTTEEKTVVAHSGEYLGLGQES